MSAYFRLRHLCLATRDLERAKRDIPEIFGVQLGHVDPLASDFEVDNAIFPFGTSVIEIMAPLSDAAPSARFLQASGGRGGYLMGFNCSDPRRRAERANALGVRTAAEVVYRGFIGWQLHPRDCRAAMLEFDHTEGGEDVNGPLYAAGGTDWHSRIKTDVTRRILEVIVESPKPRDLAEHWSKLLECPWVSDNGGAHIDMAMFPIRFQASAAGLREAFVGIRLEVRDPQATLAAARQRGYTVNGRAIEMCGVSFLLEPDKEAKT